MPMATRPIDPAARATAERKQTDDKKYRSGRRNVERENLDDQRSANICPNIIARAGTRPTNPSVANEVVINPVAVLL